MKRFAQTVAIYLFLGPPISAVASAILASGFWQIHDGTHRDSLADMLSKLLMMIAWGIPLSFFLGGAQALFVGVATAAWERLKRPAPLAVPLTFATLAWGIFTLLMSSAVSGEGKTFSELALSGDGGVWLANHIIAAVAGWWLVRRWLSAPP